jgi:hypothetical protein
MDRKITFDATQYLEATTPPTFIAPNGKSYTGRVLSYPQWLPYREALTNFAIAAVTDQDVRRFGKRFLKNIFPRPWWKIWERPVWKWVFELPPIRFMEAMESFIASQEQMMGTPPGKTKNESPPEAS